MGQMEQKIDDAGFRRATPRQEPVQELGVLRPDAGQVLGGGEEGIEDGMGASR